MFTKEAQALAKATVEAIKKIAERQEKECPKCRGLRKFPLSKKRIVAAPKYTHIKCPVCNGTGKVKWEWEPEVGEWCLYGNAILLITKVTVSVLEVSGGRIEAVKADKVIPLLSWERIEEILEGMGYLVQILGTPTTSWKNYIWSCNIRKETTEGFPSVVTSYNSKTRQLAVMQAVIKLAKED